MSASTPAGIVVGVDDSPASNAAISWATRKAIERHLPLTLVHAVNSFAVTWPQAPETADLVTWEQVTGRRILDQASKVAHDSNSDDRPLDIDTKLCLERPAPTLIGLSKRAELVVVGNRGRGALARHVLGSISASLVTHAHCPVAVIRATAAAWPDHAQAPVVLGTDGSASSDLATDIAFEEASRSRACLIAVHAWTDFLVEEFPRLDWSVVEAEAQRRMIENLAGWRKLYPEVTVHLHVVRDRPAHAVVEEARSAQLVVIGSHGRGAVARTLLGSVSNAVVQAVQVPVIVARR